MMSNINLDIDISSKQINSIFEIKVSALEQISSEKAKRPVRANDLDELIDLFNKNLYYQLLESCSKYLVNGSVVFGKYERIEFFVNVLYPLKNKFNPLKFIVFVEDILKQSCLNSEEALSILYKMIDNNLDYTNSDEYHSAKLEIISHIPSLDVQSDLYTKLLICFEFTKLNNYLEKSEEILEFVTKHLTVMKGVEPNILGLYHKSYAKVEYLKNHKTLFYNHTLSYLSYIDISLISNNEKLELCYELIMAAVTSDEIYNLGELVLHQLIQDIGNLRNSMSNIEDLELCDKITKYSWIIDILVALHEGDINLYETALKKHQEVISGTILNDKSVRASVTRKVKTLSLMDLIFKRNKNDRVISFDDISKYCKVEGIDIEILVIKAINMKLISGIIDEVQSVVEITWVNPRVLDKSRVALLGSKVDIWLKNTTILTNELEPMMQEFLVA